MEFGVFDHVDDNGLPLQEFYEGRLQLIQAYDRAGFFAYHVAEHHSTPLGMSSSPSVFLAAVAQRTNSIRLGPMVYTLPLYHPLRLIEEICMLDQLSRGRLLVGVGKGISPIEASYFGLAPQRLQAMFDEGLQILRQGLTSKRLSFHGEYYNFEDVPIVFEPVQKPHPPLWYGVVSVDSARRMAQLGFNIITNAPSTELNAISQAYWKTWTEMGRPAGEIPKLGFSRYVVVAETDSSALEIARRAYRKWYDSFFFLWRMKGLAPVAAAYPESFDELEADGRGIAGCAAKVVQQLQEQLAGTAMNYLVVRLAFGDLTLSESLRSLDLFRRYVMPKLQLPHAAAA